MYRRPCLTASFACKGSQYHDDVHLSGERAASVIICTAFRDHRHAAVSTRRGEPRSKHKSLFPLSIRFHRYEGSNINTTPDVMMLPFCANAVVAALFWGTREEMLWCCLCHVSFEWQPPPFPISLLMSHMSGDGRLWPNTVIHSARHHVLLVVSPLQIKHTDISPESSLRVISLSLKHCSSSLDFKMSPAAKEGESSVQFGGRFNKK